MWTRSRDHYKSYTTCPLFKRRARLTPSSMQYRYMVSYRLARVKSCNCCARSERTRTQQREGPSRLVGASPSRSLFDQWHASATCRATHCSKSAHRFALLLRRQRIANGASARHAPSALSALRSNNDTMFHLSGSSTVQNSASWFEVQLCRRRCAP